MLHRLIMMLCFIVFYVFEIGAIFFPVNGCRFLIPEVLLFAEPTAATRFLTPPAAATQRLS